MSSMMQADPNKLVEALSSREDWEYILAEAQVKRNDRLVKKGKETVSESEFRVHYFDPTYDRTFKWIVSGQACPEFTSTFFDTMLFLAYKGLVKRKVRKFECGAMLFDAATERFSRMPSGGRVSVAAISADVPGELLLSEANSSADREGGGSADIAHATRIAGGISKVIDEIGSFSEEVKKTVRIATYIAEIAKVLNIQGCNWDSVLQDVRNIDIEVSEILDNVLKIRSADNGNNESKESQIEIEKKRISELQKESEEFLKEIEGLACKVDAARWAPHIEDVSKILNRASISRISVNVESQHRKQLYIEARNFQYGAIKIILQKAINLLPMLLVSVCRWNADEVIRHAFHVILDKGTKSEVPISQVTINVAPCFDPVGKQNDDVTDKRRSIKCVFKKALRDMFPEYVSEEGNSKLKIPHAVSDCEDVFKLRKKALEEQQKLGEQLDKIEEKLDLFDGKLNNPSNMSFLDTQQNLEDRLRKVEGRLEKVIKKPEETRDLEKMVSDSAGHLKSLKSLEETIYRAEEQDKVRITYGVRTAYELLCFLSLAPLTPKLGDNKRVYNPVIKKAYEMMELNSKIMESRPELGEWYVGIANAQQKAEDAQQKAQIEREGRINDLVKTTLYFVTEGFVGLDVDVVEATQKYVKKNIFSDPKNAGLRQDFVKGLESRAAKENENAKELAKRVRKMYDDMPNKSSTVSPEVRKTRTGQKENVTPQGLSSSDDSSEGNDSEEKGGTGH